MTKLQYENIYKGVKVFFVEEFDFAEVRKGIVVGKYDEDDLVFDTEKGERKRRLFWQDVFLTSNEAFDRARKINSTSEIPYFDFSYLFKFEDC